MFKLDQSANANMTSLQGYVTVAPAMLVKLFGAPGPGDDYKVSGEYLFTDEFGHVFTLYDWKHTSLYDDCTLSPKSFWASEVPYEFHIGAHVSDVSMFAEFIKMACELAELA